MKSKRAFGSLILTPLLILPLVLAPPTASGQSNSAQLTGTQQGGPDDLIRVDTNLVTIPARVMDQECRYVTDLRKEDFQIFEDGVAFVDLLHPEDQLKVARSFSGHIARTMTRPAPRDPIQATINSVTISDPKSAEYVLMVNTIQGTVACHLVHKTRIIPSLCFIASCLLPTACCLLLYCLLPGAASAFGEL